MSKKKPARKSSKRTPKPRATNPAPTQPPRRPVRYRATPSAVSGKTALSANVYIVAWDDEQLVSRGEPTPLIIDHEFRTILVSPDVSVDELRARLASSSVMRFGLLRPGSGETPTHALAVAIADAAFIAPAPSEAE